MADSNIRPQKWTTMQLMALVASLVALVAAFAIAATPAADAAVPPPKTGGWKVKKGHSSEPSAKSGTAKIAKGGKQLSKLKIKPSKITADRCGHSKPIHLTKKLKIKKLNGSWQIAKSAGEGWTVGVPAKVKVGGTRYKGFVNFQFWDTKSGSGTLRIEGCSIYFRLKK